MSNKLFTVKWLMGSVFLLLSLSPLTYGQDRYILNKGTPNNNVNNLLRRFQRAVLKHHPSLVIIMIGTNDMINPPKMLSYPDYESKLSQLVEKIKNHDIALLLLALPYVDTADLFARRKRKKFSELPNVKIDSANAIIKTIADHYHCMFLDLNRIFVDHQSQDKVIPHSLLRNRITAGKTDGVHPNPAGYRLIAESIFQLLENENRDFPKIICFGDSITFGAYAKGEGGTRGETYPAVLKRLLKIH